MGHLKLFEIFTILCIIYKTHAFNCWCCSSGDRDSEFCGKILDEPSLTHYQNAVNLVKCSDPEFKLLKGRDLITKCLIQKTIHNGTIFYSRSCIWEESNAEKYECMKHSPLYGHQILACETCMQDKCNYQFQCDSHSTVAFPFFEIILISAAFLLII